MAGSLRDAVGSTLVKDPALFLVHGADLGRRLFAGTFWRPVVGGAHPGSEERPMVAGFVVFPVVVSPFSEAGPTDFSPFPRPVVEASWAKAAADATDSIAAERAIASFITCFSVKVVLNLCRVARQSFASTRSARLNGHWRKKFTPRSSRYVRAASREPGHPPAISSKK